MELQQLRYVVAVAETRNFTRAAERCRVVQSALSHQIAGLERELGARLFERTSRRVRLTTAGEAFLPAARECLEAADRARAEVAAVAGEIRGRLAVGAIPTVAAVDLPVALRDYRRRHPRVHITLTSAGSDDLIERVRRGEVDVAFLGLPPRAEPKGVRGRRLGGGELVAVVAPDYPRAEEETDLRSLADEPFIDFRAGAAGRVQSDEAFAAAGVRREVPFEVSSAELMVDLVRQGLGVGMLPAAYAPRFADLRVIRLRDAPTRVEHLIWDSRPSPAATAFLDLLAAGGAPGPAGRHLTPDDSPADRPDSTK
ncbi:transcriptional regulator [Sphaerisporangium krabiense]|uniref:DNA-binding transcriptional LysR family regulator n=1 Tax=Sphaerisporangium krabiense TaxID=763782 RepID=A0A7W8ZC97_9ACTN|nr:LysR family transcriptional regulator [Sphaerisporangium krabiense]MBB5631245.1 DNA-binding transcriptional LysR family regulator [Sphaerisporangium krabiense]GII61142.1 transcriptional regulator [Sphaerisporangium krabiense]